MRVFTDCLRWALVLGAACGDAPPPAAPARVLQRGQELLLSVGESVQLAEAPATRIRFEGVVSDQRCALGAQCSVAGAVTVAFDLLAADGGKRTVQLALLDGSGPSACVALGGGALSLREVEPHPSPDGPVKRDEYRVRITSTEACPAAGSSSRVQ